MVHILYSKISEDNHERLLKYFSVKYSIDFQNKIMKYRRWQDAQLSLLGRILLFRGIKLFNKDYDERNIKYTKYKKPYFEDKEIQFNISHSGEMVVCALTDTCNIGIGIDIELLCNIPIEDFKPQMTKNEWKNIIMSPNKINSFYSYWTKKEAAIKAHGNGLHIPLDSFEIIQNKTNINKECFYLKKIRLDNKYKCYISTNTPINKIPITISEFIPFRA